MNVLDKVIGYISPRLAYKRMAWRQGIRSYEAGNITNSNQFWVPYNAKAEQTNETQRDFIRARARDRERNSDFIQALIKSFERNVVGSGFRVQSQCRDEELQTKLEEIFANWSMPRNCDVTGQMSFTEICKMIIRRRLVDGGILIVKTYNGNKKYPFQLQLREVDDLDDTVLTGKNGNLVINGVELNAYQKPVAYHLKVYAPDGYYTGKTERIDAQRVIPLWVKTMPSQVREMSELSAILSRVNDIDDYIYTVSLKEKILAALTVFIKRTLPAIANIGRNNTSSKREPYKETQIKSGMIMELQPGDDISSVIPNGQAQNAKEFISTMHRIGASAIGLSYETATRDMSNVNYSSARQNLLEDQKTFEDWQSWLNVHFLHEIYTEVIISAQLAGTINIKDFWENKELYLKHRWISPGWSWIDPQKEVNANKTAIETGQDNLINICAKSGLDYREVLEGQAKVAALKKQLEEKYNIGGDEINGKSKKSDTNSSDATEGNDN